MQNVEGAEGALARLLWVAAIMSLVVIIEMRQQRPGLSGSRPN